MNMHVESKPAFYGGINQTSAGDETAVHVEEVMLRGYTVMTGLYRPDELAGWREKIDVVYAKQEADFGRDALERIGDLDVARAPLLHDFEFVELARHPRVLSVVRYFLGDWFILNVQNAIINRPATQHHQIAWHRDLPYQNYVITRPLAISALLTVDEFSALTGGTHVLPFTHKTEMLPSDRYIERNQVVVDAPAGAAILFDSMLFHRAGANNSRIIRRGVNNVYSTAMIKQNYDFPRALGPRADLGPELERLLGYTSQVPRDERAWREGRSARKLGGR